MKVIKKEEFLEDLAIRVSLQQATEDNTIEAIPLDKIKQAREEIDDLNRYFDNDLYTDNTDSMFKCSEVLEILDKLIAESGDEQMRKIVMYCDRCGKEFENPCKGKNKGIKDISELGNNPQKNGSSGIKDISELGGGTKVKDISELGK